MTTDIQMWAVNVQGPDGLFPAPDREVADAVCLILNRQYKRFLNGADDVLLHAVVVEWPYGYESWSAGKDQWELQVKPSGSGVNEASTE